MESKESEVKASVKFDAISLCEEWAVMWLAEGDSNSLLQIALGGKIIGMTEFMPILGMEFSFASEDFPNLKKFLDTAKYTTDTKISTEKYQK